MHNFNLQIEMRKALDWINSQPPVVRVILFFALVVFVIIPFSVPAAIIYIVWAAFKGRDQAK